MTEEDIKNQYSFNPTNDRTDDDNGKKLLCSILTFILSILFLIVSIFWILNSPVKMEYYNISSEIPITLPDQQVFIDTDHFFACDCVMYNITFSIISPYLFSVSSNQTYNITNITYENGLYHAIVTDNDNGINYFDMTISLSNKFVINYDTKKYNTIKYNITINGSYGTFVIAPIALAYSIPLIMSIVVMIVSLYKMGYYCRIKKMIRNEYLTSSLIFSL